MLQIVTDVAGNHTVTEFDRYYKQGCLIMKRMTAAVIFVSAFFCCSAVPAAENGPDRAILPIKDPQFKGKIGKTFADSKQDYP